MQEVADRVRRDRALHQAADTHKWLESRKLSVDDLEEEARVLVLRSKLVEVLTGDQIEKHFHEHKSRLDLVVVSHLVVKEEGVARELLTQIEEDEAEFEKLAREHSLDEKTSGKGGFVGPVRRGQGRPEVEALVFGARPDDVVGPFELKAGWEPIKILEVRPATLDEATRVHIRRRLFREWLNEQLSEAGVKLGCE